MLLACTLLVAAAADLAPLEQRIAQALPECQVRLSFGSSGTLARQIAHGADFDVFLAASRKYVNQVVSAGAAEAASVRTYARGRIAVWSRDRRTGWRDLTRARQLSIANPVHAPYGLAAKQALERKGLWASVQPKIVFGENVRQAWQFAASGNTDATVTAWTLVHDKGGELLPESWHDPILQTAVIPNRSRNPDGAKRLLNWLTSAAGQKALAESGLTPVSPSR